MMPQYNTQPRIITLSIHLYDRLLWLGPKEFREEYGEETLKDFRHCCHEAYTRGRICGVLCLWPSMFTRGIVDMGAERFSEAMRQEKKHSPKHMQMSELAAGVILITVFMMSILYLSRAPLSSLFILRTSILIIILVFTRIKSSRRLSGYIEQRMGIR